MIKPYLITGSIDTTAKIWNIRNGSCLRTINYLGPVDSIKTSKGPFDLIGSKQGEPMLLDHTHNLNQTLLTHDKHTTSTTLSEDGSVALLATDEGDIKIIDTKSKKTNMIHVDHEKERDAYLFHLVKSRSKDLSDQNKNVKQNSNILHSLVSKITNNLTFKDAIGAVHNQSDKFTTLIHSITEMKDKFYDMMHSLILMTKMRFAISAIEISHDNKQIISVIEKNLQIVERESGDLIRKINFDTKITVIKLFQDIYHKDDKEICKEQILVGCMNGQIQMKQITGKLVQTFKNEDQDSIITQIYVKNSIMIVANQAGYIFAQDLVTKKELFNIPPNYNFSSHISSVYLSQDQPQIQVGYINGVITTQDQTTKMKIREIHGHIDSVTSIDTIQIDDSDSDFSMST